MPSCHVYLQYNPSKCKIVYSWKANHVNLHIRTKIGMSWKKRECENHSIFTYKNKKGPRSRFRKKYLFFKKAI